MLQFSPRKLLRYLFSFFLLFSFTQAHALVFDLPTAGNNVIGKVQWTQALPGDTFSKIGRRYDVGYYELVEANPALDPYSLPPGTLVVIPTQFILPPGPRQGLIINLAELRLYYYPPHSAKVVTFPVGIGREGWDTPLGPSKIVQKMFNPIWTVPESIRKDRAKDGVFLPLTVPPGPDNPLGGYAMRLQQITYLIHGSNDDTGIGRRSSSGCIRLLPEDIETLYREVKVGVTVQILDSPIKMGRNDNKIFLEVHVPLTEIELTNDEKNIFLNRSLKKILGYNAYDLKPDAIAQATTVQSGIPREIGTILSENSAKI